MWKVDNNRLTLPIPNRLVNHTSAGRKCHRAGGPLLGRPMGAVNAPNANLSDADRSMPPSLLLAYVDVFGRGLKIFQLPAEESQAVG